MMLVEVVIEAGNDLMVVILRMLVLVLVLVYSWLVGWLICVRDMVVFFKVHCVLDMTRMLRVVGTVQYIYSLLYNVGCRGNYPVLVL